MAPIEGRVSCSGFSGTQSTLSAHGDDLGAQDLYEILLDSDGLSFMPGILFGWWPQSSSWGRKELVQCSTQCLPAVRPGRDLVALPSLPEVQELWKCWGQEHGLTPHQAVWFEPRLEGKAVQDPAMDVCREVLSSLAGAREALQQLLLMGGLCFYPWCLTPGVVSEAACNGLRVVGQVDMLLNHGKTWRHPHISGSRSGKAPSFRDLLPRDLSGVRYLRGYVADDVEGLRQAWKQLQWDCPRGSRFVLKPVGASGGFAPIADVKESDVQAFAFEALGVSGATVALEEMVGGAGPPEPRTLDMVGSVPCGSLGQEGLPGCCVLAAQRIGELWGIRGHWSLDFAGDGSGARVLAGISIGCPSQTFAVKLWASRATHPLATFTGKWTVPQQGPPSISDITESLRSAELLWDGDEGVIVYQHNPGAPSAYAVTSSFGDQAVKVLGAKLAQHMWESFGMA